MDSFHPKLSETNLFLDHGYGDGVHLLDDIVSQTLLTRFSQKQCVLPELNYLLKDLYKVLLNSAIKRFFPKELVEVPTRMSEITEKGVLKTEVISPKTNCAIVGLARAGTSPGLFCLDDLSVLLNPENVRLDHVYVARKTDSSGKVTGVDFAGSKIGGDKEQTIVLLPDPMGATGTSICHVVDFYKNEVKGKEIKFIGLHLIITPEYIRKVKQEHPDFEIMSLRLDRGLSSDNILKTSLGEKFSEEKGLNEVDYIVPGAGGVGEVLNNSFV